MGRNGHCGNEWRVGISKETPLPRLRGRRINPWHLRLAPPRLITCLEGESRGGGGSRRRPNSKSEFFFSNILCLEILPCFFAFFKKFGSISPRIAIIVSTSRSFSSLSYIFYLLPHPSHYFSKVFLKLRLIFSLVLVEL